MQAIFKNVRREHFTKLADMVWNDNETKAPVVVYYTGTGLRGDMTIDCRSNEKAYKKALNMFNNIINEEA